MAKTYEEALRAEVERIFNLVLSKHTKYNRSAALCRRGEQGFFDRIEDKLDRFEYLRKQHLPDSQEAKDEADDIIGYLLQRQLFLDGTISLPLTESSTSPTG